MLRAKGTSITRYLDTRFVDADFATKKIMFTDVGMGEGTLDQYLLGRNAPAVGGSRMAKFRPVGTRDNEVCLFPSSTSMRLCLMVASLFSASLATYAVDSSPLLRINLLNRNERGRSQDSGPPAAPIIDRRSSSIARDAMQQQLKEFELRNNATTQNDVEPTRPTGQPRRSNARYVPMRR